jgi:hypothetical protein
MGETGFETPPATGITPDIAEEQLKEGIVGYPGQHPESEDAPPPEEFVVRLRKNQMSVAFRLNTKRMLERREIEQANDAIRRSGR